MQQESTDLRKTATEKTTYDDAYFAVPAPPTLRNPGEPAPAPVPSTPPAGKKKMNSTPSIVVTGISGNLGRQLLPLLSSFRVVGVDFRPPQTDLPLQFEQMDLAEEA